MRGKWYAGSSGNDQLIFYLLHLWSTSLKTMSYVSLNSALILQLIYDLGKFSFVYFCVLYLLNCTKGKQHKISYNALLNANV